MILGKMKNIKYCLTTKRQKFFTSLFCGSLGKPGYWLKGINLEDEKQVKIFSFAY